MPARPGSDSGDHAAGLGEVAGQSGRGPADGRVRLGAALSRWEKYSFTRALRAVDAGRIAAEQERAPSGAPLDGLLFSVKDVFPVAGVESCAGSLLLSGHVPQRDQQLIARLRAAGAAVFGKGVCPEFAVGIMESKNRLDGRVTHWSNPRLSPGGSSGGDAVAVGAGVVDFAIAGDYGGSIRWPAEAAGVYGLRLGVTHPLAGIAATGRIGLRPRDSRNRGTAETTGAEGEADPPASLQTELEVAGIMARSPGMVRAVLAALADGPGGRTSPPARTMRLIMTDGTEIAPVLPQVATAVDAARRTAVRNGYALVPAPDGLRDALAEAVGAYNALRAATDDHWEVRRLAAGQEQLLCGSTLGALNDAERTVAHADPAEVALLRERASAIGAQVRSALSEAEADALLLPVTAAGPIAFDAVVEVAGRTLSAADLMAHCRAVSLTGLPALSVPVGGGLSVQFVGPDGGETALCVIATDLAAYPPA